MRKGLIIGFGVMFALTLAVIIITSTAKVKERFITISNNYSYVYSENKKMEVPLYVNLDNHPLFQRKYIRHVELLANNNGFRETLRLSEIKEDGKEKYLNEYYHKLIYVLDIPKLGSNCYLPNTYLSIELEGFSTNYLFYIGDVTFYYYPNVGEEEAFTLESLEGFKSEDGFVSRLAKIKIGCNLRDAVEITNIEVSKSFKLNYYITGNDIVLEIPEGNQMLSNVPIIIDYRLNNETRSMVIDNFVYFKDYFLLLDNGVFANVYPID